MSTRCSEPALAASPKAKATLEGLAPSHRREYLEWITEAKREGTRAKRRAELRDYKTGARTKKPKKIRHAVKDTATGEERIFKTPGRFIERHRQRKAEAKTAARAKAQGERVAR